ncbi:MAG: four helix bundle protein [Candidatus Kapaibacteriota bacterium]|jgi:four helix bundle protein
MSGPEREDLRIRTKRFALRIIQLYPFLPHSTEAQVIGKQVLRSGTSVCAQYREGFRAKSNADFVNKLQGALQELEETGYWLELLIEAELVPAKRLQDLLQEAETLKAILVTIIRKVKQYPRDKGKE